MKTLLLAIGIIIAFGSLFLLDRWNTGFGENSEDIEDEEEEENP